MTGPDALRQYQALYVATVGELTAPLTDAGDAFASMLAELARDPQPDRVERVLVRLEGIRSHLHQLHRTLTRAGG